jgi:ATP-dependent Clp protease ATP-binding subunit ClpC
MLPRFTEQARQAMQLANQEAVRFHHEYVGTEHILLGLVREGNGSAAALLARLGVELRMVRLGLEKIVQWGPAVAATGKLPQTPRAKKVIEYSIEEARNLNHNYVGTEHLLLGLLREQEGVAAQVLMNLGLRMAEVRDTLLALLTGAASPPCEASPVPPDEGLRRAEEVDHLREQPAAGPQLVAEVPPRDPPIIRRGPLGRLWGRLRAWLRGEAGLL